MGGVMGMPERAVMLVAGALCGGLLVWALALAFADLAMARPRSALAAWERGEPLGDYRARRRLLARMGSAVAAHPLDGAQRLDLGRFFAWHAARHGQGSARARFYHRLAADRFEEAITARPTWGHAWLLLAERWMLLGVDAHAARAAMQRGAALAPLEPAVQLKYLWLGLAQWRALDAADRARLGASLDRLLDSRVHFADAARIALHHGRGDLVSRALRAPWQQQAFAALAGGRGG